MNGTTSRAGALRRDWRTRKPPAPPPTAPPSQLPLVAIVVPFREQAQQDRKAQLDAFVKHMTQFLRGRRFAIVVAQQSHDGRSFNRGALLNVGFVEARRLAGAAPLASVVFHDVDLLPSPGLLKWYLEPPSAGRPTHIAAPSAWGKYAMPGYEAVFFGGVTALHPADFGRANGFPNDYWGWGMEDDQLRLRVEASGGLAHGVLRPPAGAGTYRDIDSVAMLEYLNQPDTRLRHAHEFNQLMFRHDGKSGGTRRLDADWRGVNGLNGLRYEERARTERSLSRDCAMLTVEVQLGG